MKEFFKPTFSKVILLIIFSLLFFSVSIFVSSATTTLGFPFSVFISYPSTDCGFETAVQYGDPSFIVCDGRQSIFSLTGLIGNLLIAYLLACLMGSGTRKLVRALPESKRMIFSQFSSAFTLRPDFRKILWTVGLLLVTGIPHYINPSSWLWKGGDMSSFGFPLPYLSKYFCNGCMGDQWGIEWLPLVVDLIAIYLLVALVVGSVRYLRLTRATHNHYDDATPPPAN